MPIDPLPPLLHKDSGRVVNDRVSDVPHTELKPSPVPPIAPPDATIGAELLKKSQQIASGGSALDVRTQQVGVDSVANIATTSGPLPDFAPTSGVLLHAYLKDSAYARALVREFGAHVGFTLRDQDVSKSDPSEFWMQDWAPKRRRLHNGTLRLIGSLSPFPKRSGVFGGTMRNPVKPELTFHPSPNQPVISTGPLPGAWAEHQLLPLVLEGGNVVSVGGKLIVTDKVISDNAKDWAREHGLTHLGPHSGYTPRGADEVKKLLADAYGVAGDDVVVVPRMPGERTGHSDMFILPLSDDTVCIPQIRPDAFDVVGFPHEQQLGHQVQAFLDDIAAQIAAHGLKVERLPMMPPIHLEPSQRREQPAGYEALVATPTQSTLFDVTMDGKSVKRAFIPMLPYDGFGSAYQQKAAGFADDAALLFARFGFEARRYDASDIFFKKGGGHCVSVPAPG